MQEEVRKRQQAELEQSRIAASVAKENDNAEGARKQAAAEKQYTDQLREADCKAQQAKISELKALHEIEITRKQSRMKRSNVPKTK